MATPLQLIEALKTRLATITGLAVYDYVPEGLVPPAAIVQLVEVDYVDEASMGRGMYSVDFEVTVLVGATGIPAAIHDDRTLGLADTSALVRSARSIGREEYETYQHWGAVLVVRCNTKGT
jgi:hypothetical protein